MAAESNTTVDIEIWIEKVIRSCENYKQYLKANKLVDIYIKQLRQTIPHYQATHIRDRLENILWEQKESFIKSPLQLMKG